MGGLSTNYNFQLPYENEYYSIDIVNRNTSAIDTAIMTSSRREYIVAAANSSDHWRRKADVCCDTDDSHRKIQKLINRAESSSVIHFCAGTYNMFADTVQGLVVSKKLHFTGDGINSTIFRQRGLRDGTSPGASLFTVTAANVTMDNMMLAEYETPAAPAPLLNIGADSIELRNLFFVHYMAAGLMGNSIKSTAVCDFTRIQDCRVYRTYSAPDKPMFDFSGYTFSGVMGGLISSGRDALSVKFKDQVSKDMTAVYGCANIALTTA